MKQDERTDRVDALFTRWAKADSPGCAIAIWQDGEVLYRQGYGIANLEYNVPITPATIFHVASVSKQFAAAAILLLERDGLLATRDQVRKYIPELHDFGTPITIDHLIHHTSGLRDQWELLTSAGWREDDVITTEDVLKLTFRQRDLNFQPGAEYAYCNTGYTLMGLIVERVSGKTLRQFCAERIFAPLGMTSTHFHDDYQEVVPNRSYSYSEKEGVFRHSHLLFGTVGATSLFTTVDDLLRWEANFFNPQVGDQAFLDKMVQLGRLNDGLSIPYASGIAIEDYRGMRTVAHNGVDAGFRANLTHFPAQKFVVTVLSNLATIPPWTLALKIADIYLAEHLHDDPAPMVTLPEADLQARVGWYYSELTRRTMRITYDEGLCLWASEKLEALDAQHFRMVNNPDVRVEFSDHPAQFALSSSYERPILHTRIEPITLPPERVADYAGVYHSDELDADYTFLAQNGALSQSLRKMGIIPLTPTFADAFVDPNFETDFLFTRDASGSINGLKVSSGRIRNLSFIRQANLD